MTAEEAEQIAAFFVPDPLDDPAPRLGDVTRGRELFERRRCSRCHHYGASGVVEAARSDDLAVRLAPDLRRTRERMSASSLLRWLTSPRAVKPDTLMPEPGLSSEQRRDVAAFILEAPLGPAPPERIPERLPRLSRRITYAEVETRVFRRVCRHCHADPEPMDGDGGPGNTGGFGFEGRGIDLSSYDAIRASPELLEDDGSGLPLLVGAMWRRHLEVAGITDERRGMPLGLPPMTLAEIQLVETWVAQGALRR